MTADCCTNNICVRHLASTLSSSAAQLSVMSCVCVCVAHLTGCVYLGVGGIIRRIQEHNKTILVFKYHRIYRGVLQLEDVRGSFSLGVTLQIYFVTHIKW